jgi:hypothetical protein
MRDWKIVTPSDPLIESEKTLETPNYLCRVYKDKMGWNAEILSKKDDSLHGQVCSNEANACSWVNQKLNEYEGIVPEELLVTVVEIDPEELRDEDETE